MKKIHVNSMTIRGNAEKQRDDPVMLLHDDVDTIISGSHIMIHGPSCIVWNPNSPLSCGATVWIETEAEVTVTGGNDVTG